MFHLAKARELSIKASDLGLNPIFSSRDPDFPVGLKVFLARGFMQIIYICALQNLGATCYANAFLQVCILNDVRGVLTYGVWRCGSGI